MSENTIAKFSTRFALLIAAVWILTPVAASADPPEVSPDNQKFMSLRLEVGETQSIEAGPNPYAEQGTPPYAPGAKFEGKEIFHLDQNLFDPAIKEAVADPDNGVVTIGPIANGAATSVAITGAHVGMTTVRIRNRYTDGFHQQGYLLYNDRDNGAFTEDRERTVFVTVYAKVAAAGNFNAGGDDQGAGVSPDSEQEDETPSEDSNPNSADASGQDTRVGQTPASGSDIGLLDSLIAIRGQTSDSHQTPTVPTDSWNNDIYQGDVPLWEFINSQRMNDRSANDQSMNHQRSRDANPVPTLGRMPRLDEQRWQTAGRSPTLVVPNGNAGPVDPQPRPSGYPVANSQLGVRTPVQVNGTREGARPIEVRFR